MTEQNIETVDCIVIGAGVSGLVSAARMAAAGRKVLVLEAAARVGGCIQSWHLSERIAAGEAGADFWLELGAHTAYNSYSQLLEALRERGRLEDLLPREKLGYSFVGADGSLHSPLKRLSFLQAAFSLPFGIGRAKPGRSVAEWFGGLLGRGNYRRLLAPAFAAVLSQPADAFPAEWLFRRKPRMQSAPRKYSFPGGLQSLLEALIEGAAFELRYQAGVSGVSRSDVGYLVQTAAGVLNCRQLILAVPVDAAAGLLSEIQPDIARELQTFPMSSSEALGVVLPAGRSSLKPVAGLIGVDDDFWSVVTRDPIPHDTLRGFTFHFRPGRLDRAAKLARAAAVLGVTPADFLHVRETINRLPAPGVEHPRRVAAIDTRLAREPLALVGNYLNGLSIGDCAERAAAETARLLSL
jgi:protoporphyrinogen/coproporphyrinogen III oxidase